MFKDKRTLDVRVALEADRALLRRHPYLLRQHRAVRVMTIIALDQPFQYAVPKRHIELTFLRQMTRKAQLRLGLREQKFFRSGVMSRMAVCATHAVLGVDRIDGVHLLRASGMAAHAASIDLLRGMVFEDEELGFVAGILNVCCRRAMTALAAHLGGVASLL